MTVTLELVSFKRSVFARAINQSVDTTSSWRNRFFQIVENVF
jgi:hypothetical protein